ncbi:hypothetical protein [uncultured Sulfitobacter sp.]|uniref:hypothetical protein n=1 Tax=uncultured Sulfitobacter sp. TaxID=191468 RepID=UPI0025969D14|nr:hypothetical protein [uncultured Sulfitobacter sp.]
MKYLKRLALTVEESPNKIQQIGYRVRPVGDRRHVKSRKLKPDPCPCPITCPNR